jgi:hypothetical protein
MSYLHLPSRHRRAPIKAGKITSNLPFAFALLPGYGDIINGFPETFRNNAGVTNIGGIKCYSTIGYNDGSRVEVADNTKLSMAGSPITLMAYVYLTSNGAFSMSKGFSNGADYNELELSFNNYTTPTFYAVRANPTYRYHAQGYGSTIATQYTNNWNLIAVTGLATIQNTNRFYLNGKYLGANYYYSGTGQGVSVGYAGKPLSIFARDDVTNSNFQSAAAFITGIRGMLSEEELLSIGQDPWKLFSRDRNTTYFDVPATYPESLITINSGELETLTDTDIVAPSSLGTGAAANTFLAGDGTYKSLGTLEGSVGTILNKYNYGGF